VGRLNSEQLTLIKEKMGVDNLWSFSKLSTFDNCSWLFKLKYIDKIRVNGDSCYTYFGTIAHDLIQGLYIEEHTYKQMVDIFDQKVMEWQINDNPSLRFPSDDVRDGYIQNLKHYFSHVAQLPYKMMSERAVLAVFKGIEKFVFQGYIDGEYLDSEGNLVILDFKTSSISGFTGKKLLEKSKQLMIYAMGVIQHGRMFNDKMKKFTIDQIKIRYDMMKYCNITFMQKNGNLKTTKAERRLWVAHISNPIRKDLEGVEKEIERLEKEIAKLLKKMNMKKTIPEDAEGYSVAIGEIEAQIKDLHDYLYDPIQINEMIEQATNMNDLSIFPQFIQDKYKVEDCYIDVDLTQDILNEFEAELVQTLNLITAKSKEENKDEAFDRPRIDNSDSFFCVTLCDMKDNCKFYAEFKEHNTMFATNSEQPTDQEMLAMLGLA
jgi:hypothetical protein